MICFLDKLFLGFCFEGSVTPKLKKVDPTTDSYGRPVQSIDVSHVDEISKITLLKNGRRTEASLFAKSDYGIRAYWYSI